MRHVDTAAGVPGPAIPVLDDGPGFSRDSLVAAHRPHVGTGDTGNTRYATVTVAIFGRERQLWDYAPAPPLPVLDQGLHQPAVTPIIHRANGPRIVGRDSDKAEQTVANTQQTVAKTQWIGTWHDPPANPVPMCRQGPRAPLGSGGAYGPD